MSKFIRYCDGVMEAGWLTALVSVPLFFNFRGESVEGEKNFFLRSLALVVVGAWAARSVCHLGTNSFRRTPQRSSFAFITKPPLVAPAITIGLFVVIATLLSLSPSVSFWGVVNRRLGSFTYLCCLVFFGAMVSSIRSQQQIDRIITTAILTTVPISLYGIGQRFAIEPIMRSGGPQTFRVGATFAHPIYLGAYLLMVFPLTVSRIFLRYLHFRRTTDRPQANLIQLALYCFVALLQLITIFLTVSRGPFVGLVIGCSVMFLMLAVYWRRRWLVLGTIGAGVILLVLLVVLTRASSSGTTPLVVESDEVQRFSELLDPKVGTGAERAAAWRVAARASRFLSVTETGDGTIDRFSLVRFLFGYGPECVGFVSRLYALRDFNAALPDHILFDRFHNDFWDTLITTGMLGLGAVYAFSGLMVFFGCRALGFITTRRDKFVFWFLFAGCGILGALGLTVRFGVGFVGVGLKLGAIGGLMFYLVFLSWRNDFDSEVHGTQFSRAIVLMALVAGVIGHLMEICFSFTFETSLLYFWIYAALLVAIGHLLPSRESTVAATRIIAANTDSLSQPGNSTGQKGSEANSAPMPGSDHDHTSNSGWSIWKAWHIEAVGGIITAIALASFGFTFIQKTEAKSALRIMRDALTRLPGNQNAFTWWLLVGIALTALVFAAVWINEAGPSRQRAWLSTFAVTVVIAGIIGLIYWLVLAYWTASSISFASVTSDNVNAFLRERVFVLDFHYLFMLLMILLLPAFLAEAKTDFQPASNRLVALKYSAAVALGIAAIVIAYRTNLSWAKSGMMDKISKEEYFRRSDQWPIATAIVEAAIKAAPKVEAYYLWLGKLLIEQAAASEDPKAQADLFSKADQVLITGSRLNPLDPAFRARRGNLYLKRALAEPTPDKKRLLAKTAVEFYERAVVLDPGNFMLWNNMAYVHLTILRSMDEAERCSLRSIELQPKGHPAYGLLGDVFFQKGFVAKPKNDRELLLRRAVSSYQHALALAGTNNPNSSYRYAVGLGKSYFNLGELSQSIAAYQKAAVLSSPAERWRNEEILARLYSDTKDKTNSLVHLQRAIESAPPEKNSDLLKLKAQILSSP